MLDICLTKTFNVPPDMSDFEQEIPIVADPAFQKSLFKPSRTPGVLGLELPKELAERLLERFVASGSYGYCFPVAYHQPRITIEQATKIAAQDIEKQRLERDPTDLFYKRVILEWYPGVEMEEKLLERELTADVLDAVFLFDEYPLFWGFLANSVHMSKKHLMPGAWSASVDKIDGHIWSNEEFRRLSGGVVPYPGDN